jgi:hypothetical protein
VFRAALSNKREENDLPLEFPTYKINYHVKSHLMRQEHIRSNKISISSIDRSLKEVQHRAEMIIHSTLPKVSITRLFVFCYKTPNNVFWDNPTPKEVLDNALEHSYRIACE